MKFDVIIIGGGLAGFTCGLASCEAGLKTAIFSTGESSLAFASGGIDVLGIENDTRFIENPFEQLPSLPPFHPYRKLPAGALAHSLQFFSEQMTAAGLPMIRHGARNQGRLTALGAIRPTWLSQPSQKTLPLNNPASGIQRVAVINIAGFRDFQPPLLVAGMKKHPSFAEVEFATGNIKPETLNLQTRNANELRALELARTLKRDLLSQPNGINILASALLKAAGDADFVVLPSVIAVENGNELIAQLESLTGLSICEVATMPPSLPGLRLANKLKQRFRQLGGLFVEGDEVIGGHFDGAKLCAISTTLNPSTPVEADHFVLATGGFFSRGLMSEHHALHEPVFGLPIDAPEAREAWSDQWLLTGAQHGFVQSGVATDQHFRPSRLGTVIENLYCAGNVLSGFNPIKEASAGGVAISTGWFAAQQIISETQKHAEAVC